MAHPPPPPNSRRDQQQRNRAALVFAAREVFARDGYHGAGLDVIAREAGFSKGVVYSNFTGKADLFLAVMDENIATIRLDPARGGVMDAPGGASTPDMTAAEFKEALRGFSLATLEFIAVAARDPRLHAEIAKRVAMLLEGYAAMADAEAGAPAEGLSRLERGALLTALDQGSAVLSLAGVDQLDDRSFEIGMRALMSAAPTPAEGPAGPGRAGLHRKETGRRIADRDGRDRVDGTGEAAGSGS